MSPTNANASGMDMASDGPATKANPPTTGTSAVVESRSTPGAETAAENWFTKVMGAGSGPTNGWGSDMVSAADVFAGAVIDDMQLVVVAQRAEGFVLVGHDPRPGLHAF